MTFSFERLRRRPDVEAHDLVAVDAADRLILDESESARRGLDPGRLVVIGDAYGALTLGAAHEGAADVRVHQDALTGQRALALNAGDAGLGEAFASLPLDAELVRDARVVLLRLPRSLQALRDIAGLIAAHAADDVVVYAGGRLKHMTVAMNDVLGAFFARVDVTHARQKSRVLVARGPHDGVDPVPDAARVTDLAGVSSLELRGFGGAFAGARLDLGTRLLLTTLAAELPSTLPGTAGDADDPLIDLACGTGAVAAFFALRYPHARVYACDQSAAAVRSSRATLHANGVAERVAVAHDDALGARADRSATLIALNPPFHSGAALTGRIAEHLFADAARVLRPGGQLWCVWNSPLHYRPVLQRLIGPTRQIARDAKFTVTVSTRR